MKLSNRSWIWSSLAEPLGLGWFYGGLLPFLIWGTPFGVGVRILIWRPPLLVGVLMACVHISACHRESWPFKLFCSTKRPSCLAHCSTTWLFFFSRDPHTMDFGSPFGSPGNKQERRATQGSLSARTAAAGASRVAQAPEPEALHSQNAWCQESKNRFPESNPGK